MTSPSSLQDSLFSRHPDLQWLLDPQGSLIEPLLHQWGVQVLRTQQYAQAFNDAKDVFAWAIEKNASAPALQTTFDWLHRTLVVAHGNGKTSDAFLQDLKKDKPQLLQELMRNLPLVNSVWDTSFAMKYAPDPQDIWQANPHWQTFYSGGSPLGWSKKESVQHNSSRWSLPTEDSTKSLHAIMGPKAFSLWLYGAYMHLLSQNSQTPNGAPAGRTYGLAAALSMIEPAIRLGLAPDAKTLATDTVRRYKGQGLVEDMLKGLDYCMEKYEEEGFQRGLEYCSAMLNTIIPFAIQEGLANSRNALGMDQKITHALHHGRIEESIASAWFEERITSGRKQSQVNIKAFSPLWPEDLRTKLVLLEADHLRPTLRTLHTHHVLDVWSKWDYEPTSTKAILDTMTPEQWAKVQDALDNNDRTSDVVALLKTDHPWVETYKSSNRARIAVVAACMVFINETAYVQDPKYRGLAGLFSANNQTPLGQMSLPQPLFYFASCFPQYRDMWQRLACEMAKDIPMGAKTPPIRPGTSQSPDAAKRVVNALASLMLGKTVDAENLLQMRAAIDPDMTYEHLVETQLNTAESFTLPDTFDENMFADDSLQM